MMTDLINLKIEELRSLKGLKSSRPDMPVPVAFQEAMDLYAWCLKDKDALVRAHLDWKFAEELPLRAETLSKLQTEYTTGRLTLADCQLEWKTALPLARKLQAELLRHFFYVFRGRPDLYSKVQAYSRMKSHPELIQSLINLSTFGRDHQDVLERFDLDISLLDQAWKASFDLGDLHGRVYLVVHESYISLDLRNKAFFHLKEAVSEVRRAGKYTLYNNEQRYKGYLSAFLQKRTKKINLQKEKTIIKDAK